MGINGVVERATGMRASEIARRTALSNARQRDTTDREQRVTGRQEIRLQKEAPYAK
jgi:hypothetical protein